MLPVIDSIGFLTDEDKRKLVHDNAMRVFPLFQG